MVNAYAPSLMGSYLADSRGRFRVGDPARALRQSRAPIAQLLIHPIWWGERHGFPAERLRELIHAQTRRLGPAGARQYADAVAAAFPAVTIT